MHFFARHFAFIIKVINTYPKPTIFDKQRLLVGRCQQLSTVFTSLSRYFFLLRIVQPNFRFCPCQDKKFDLKVFLESISKVFIVYYGTIFERCKQIDVEIELKYSTSICFNFLKLIVYQMHNNYIISFM